jgi:hypothetical protein
MRWPFISRERYDERVEDIRTLRAELGFERERNQRLWNFLNWRTAGGVAFDTSMLPEPYQPLPRGTQPEKSEGAGVEAIRAVRGPGQARRDLAKFEKDAQQDFERATIGSRPVRVVDEKSEPQSKAGD